MADFPVSQAAREAAAQLYGLFGDYHGAAGSKIGNFDHGSVVQTVARLEHETWERCREAAAKVAEDTAFGEGVLDLPEKAGFDAAREAIAYAIHAIQPPAGGGGE